MWCCQPCARHVLLLMLCLLSVVVCKLCNIMFCIKFCYDNNIRRSTCLAHGWQHHIGENWHSKAAASGGEYSITTDDGRVRPKHVLIEFEKWMCYIDGRKNKYSGLRICPHACCEALVPSFVHCLESNGRWRCCTTLGHTGFLNFVHRTVFWILGQVIVTLRLTVSQSVSMSWCRAHSGTLWLQGGPDSIRQFLIINNQSIQQHTGKWEITFCCR
jgi:hypothetical protein